MEWAGLPSRSPIGSRRRREQQEEAEQKKDQGTENQERAPNPLAAGSF
jgi:hypothetical protein